MLKEIRTNIIRKKKEKKTMRAATINRSNPMTRKLETITESSEKHVTFAGICNKCIYFMLTLIAGILLAVALQNVGPMVPLQAIEAKGLTLALNTLSIASTIGCLVALVVVVFVPLFAFFFRKGAAVLGTIYCASIGYVYTFMTQLFVEYRFYIALAAAITVLVCFSMILLYRSGKIVVTNKLRTVVSTLILASIIGGILLFVCGFIPALRFIPMFFAGNGIVNIAFAVVGVVIAALFLVIDFDTVTKAVENQIPVENEWYCAFSLAFSVIWLFGRVLELVIKVANATKK